MSKKQSAPPNTDRLALLQWLIELYQDTYGERLYTESAVRAMIARAAPGTTVVRALPEHLEIVRAGPRLFNLDLDRRGRALYAETDRGPLISIDFMNDMGEIHAQINDLVRRAHGAYLLTGKRRAQAFADLIGLASGLLERYESTVDRYLIDSEFSQSMKAGVAEYLGDYRKAICQAAEGNYEPIAALALSAETDRFFHANKAIVQAATPGRKTEQHTDWLAARAWKLRQRGESSPSARPWIATIQELQHLLEFEDDSQEWVLTVRETLNAAQASRQARELFIDQLKKAWKRRGWGGGDGIIRPLPRGVNTC